MKEEYNDPANFKQAVPNGSQVVLDGYIMAQTKSPQVAWHICCALRAYDETKLSEEIAFKSPYRPKGEE